MKRFVSLIAVPILAFGACGDDSSDSSGGDTTTTGQPDGTTGGPETTPPGTSDLTGVSTNVSVTTPTPAAGCDQSEVDNGNNGAKYPWGGLTAGGTNYTCNKCPTGLADFQGMWRAHGFSDADDTTPDFAKGGDASTGDAEILFIDGNTWMDQFHDQQSGQTVLTRGWFFCSQQPEHPNEHLFWVSTEADPAGTLGANAGDINESDVILSQGANLKLIFWYNDVGGTTGVQIGYCKIGSSSGGQTCNNPYE